MFRPSRWASVTTASVAWLAIFCRWIPGINVSPAWWPLGLSDELVVHLGGSYVRHPVIIGSEVTEWVHRKANDEFCEDVRLGDFSPNFELIDWPYMSATHSLLEHEFALALQKQVCFPVWLTSQFREISAASCWWIYSLTLWYPRYRLQYRSKYLQVCL